MFSVEIVQRSGDNTLMTDFHDNLPLGKSTPYASEYDPSLL